MTEIEDESPHIDSQGDAGRDEDGLQEVEEVFEEEEEYEDTYYNRNYSHNHDRNRHSGHNRGRGYRQQNHGYGGQGYEGPLPGSYPYHQNYGHQQYYHGNQGGYYSDGGMYSAAYYPPHMGGRGFNPMYMGHMGMTSPPRHMSPFMVVPRNQGQVAGDSITMDTVITNKCNYTHKVVFMYVRDIVPNDYMCLYCYVIITAWNYDLNYRQIVFYHYFIFSRSY